jgi:hypothetical protein
MTSNSKASQFFTSSGTTLALNKDIEPFSIFMVTSFEVQIVFSSASTTFTTIIFSHSSRFSKVFS